MLIKILVTVLCLATFSVVNRLDTDLALLVLTVRLPDSVNLRPSQSKNLSSNKKMEFFIVNPILSDLTFLCR